MIEVEDGVDIGKMLDEIESRVDAIDTFPEEAEEPVVSEFGFSSPVLKLAIHGEIDERALKQLGQQIRDDIAALPGVSKVTLVGDRPFEVSIEVSEPALQAYGLRFDDVVAAVRAFSLDLPGGSLRTDSGEILLRTDNQAYRGGEFAAIPLRVETDGSQITIGDVATVRDAFEENVKRTRFDGQPAVYIDVSRTGDQKALDIQRAVKDYIASDALAVPEGIQVTVWDDDAKYLGDRLGMMFWNAIGGFLLVILLLSALLKLRVAFWVAMGLPVSILGAIALMPILDIDINILTVFSFIMALGILVDDAIVTGENIHTHIERDPENPLEASIRGTQEVATPVIFGVLTTVAAFAPFMLVEGQARFLAVGMGGVMCVALLFSLVESKLVLPSHLARSADRGRPPRFWFSRGWQRLQRRVSSALDRFIETRYRPAVAACVEWRYLTVAVSFAIFLVAGAIVESGRVKQVMSPTMESDTARVSLKMPLGTPFEETAAAIDRIEASLDGSRSSSANIPRTRSPTTDEPSSANALAAASRAPARSPNIRADSAQRAWTSGTSPKRVRALSRTALAPDGSPVVVSRYSARSSAAAAPVSTGAGPPHPIVPTAPAASTTIAATAPTQRPVRAPTSVDAVATADAVSPEPPGTFSR